MIDSMKNTLKLSPLVKKLKAVETAVENEMAAVHPNKDFRQVLKHNLSQSQIFRKRRDSALWVVLWLAVVSIGLTLVSFTYYIVKSLTCNQRISLQS